MSDLGDEILEGLEQAIEYLKGDKTMAEEHKFYSVMFDFDDEEVCKAFIAWFEDGGGEYDFYQNVEQSEDFDVECNRIEGVKNQYMVRRRDEQ